MPEITQGLAMSLAVCFALDGVEWFGGFAVSVIIYGFICAIFKMANWLYGDLDA